MKLDDLKPDEAADTPFFGAFAASIFLDSKVLTAQGSCSSFDSYIGDIKKSQSSDSTLEWRDEEEVARKFALVEDTSDLWLYMECSSLRGELQSHLWLQSAQRKSLKDVLPGLPKLLGEPFDRVVSEAAFIDYMDMGLSIISDIYFGKNWDSIERLIKANAPRKAELLSRVQNHKESTRAEDYVREMSDPIGFVQGVRIVTADTKEAIFEVPKIQQRRRGVTPRRPSVSGSPTQPWPLGVPSGPGDHEHPDVIAACFTAPYCPHCQILGPIFAKVAHVLKDEKAPIGFCVIDCVECPNLKDAFNVKAFPCLKLIHKTKGDEITFPSEAPRTLDFLTSWIRAYMEGGEEAVKGMVAAYEAQKRNPIVRLRERIKSSLLLKRMELPRTFLSIGQQLRSLGLSVDQDHQGFIPDSDRVEPPTIYFIGGGMGAGKSTTVKELSKLPFWKAYGENMVIVEADAMKMKDPAYVALTEAGSSNASMLVHSASTQAAEELFLNAVKWRKDIVFDGTMSWAPFVKQTVQMVRESSEKTFARGPGYQSNGDGTSSETYWLPETRDAPSMDANRQGSTSLLPVPNIETNKSLPPYRLVMVGVTVKPETAVRRGIVRRVLTGRGVPVRGQLMSHRMFCEAFGEYVPLFDEVSLYDNNSDAKGPQLVAQKKALGDELTIYKPELMDLFRKNKLININATSTVDLYQ